MDSSLQYPQNIQFQCFACLGNVPVAENIAVNKVNQELFWKTFKLEVRHCPRLHGLFSIGLLLPHLHRILDKNL